MTRGKTHLALALVGIAVLGWAACAPVDPLPSTDKTTPTTPSTSTENVRPPEPTPHGLKERIELAIESVRRRDLLTTNGFWTVFHGILGLGPKVTLLNPDTNQRVNALDYVCEGGELRGLRFFTTAHGLDVQTGPLFVGQGHQDQFVAEVAQWGMPLNRKFLVEGKEYRYEDFVRNTQMRARTTSDQELSWAVLVVAEYIGTNVTWTNSHGELLTFDDTVRYELNAPMDPAPCGGTHRLFGLTWAYHRHLQRGGLTTGVWKEVAENDARHQQLAKKLRNPNGSFSTNFFRGPGDAGDKQLRMNTTGHTLEWLALSLTDAQLKESWVEDAANALALMFLEIRDQPMEGGTLYHAIHGLLMYYARVYGPEKLGDNAPLIPLPPKK